MSRTSAWVDRIAAVLPGPHGREAEAFEALLAGGAPGRRALAQAGAGAHDLESLVDLTRQVAPAFAASAAGRAAVPDPAFRSALRDRLVAEAAGRPALVPVPRPAPESLPRDPRGGRLRAAVVAVALTGAVAGVGAAAASSRALPGDALYGLKRQIEAVQLGLAASDLARGRELLDQAEARLGEAERLAASEGADTSSTRAALSGLLEEWALATDAGAQALTDSYRDSGDAEPMAVLDAFVNESHERLEDLMSVLDPALRDQVRAALRTLDLLGLRTSTLLATAARVATDAASTASALGTLPAADAGRVSGDGWAVSRLVDQGVVSAADGTAVLAGGTGEEGSGTALSDASGSGSVTGGSVLGDGSSTGSSVAGGTVSGGSSAGGSLTDPVGGVVDGVDSTTGSTSSGTGSTTSTGGVVDAVTPLPGVTAGPLPAGDTSTPLPTVATSPLSDTGEVTGTTAPCVPLPPLTSC